MKRQIRNILAVDVDFTARRFDQTADHIKRRCFTGTIRSEKSYYLSGTQFHTDTPNDLMIFDGFDQMIDF
jgi:hypothetical protein